MHYFLISPLQSIKNRGRSCPVCSILGIYQTTTRVSNWIVAQVLWTDQLSSTRRM